MTAKLFRVIYDKFFAKYDKDDANFFNEIVVDSNRYQRNDVANASICSFSQ